MAVEDVAPPPFPWTLLTSWAVGGLFLVGYAQDTDLLLVLSSQGRGIFDCATGEKIARDYEDAYNHFDPIRMIAPGFGPLEGRTIRMAGLYGGGLTRTTQDGWLLEERITDLPVRSILLKPPIITQPDNKTAASEPVVIGNDRGCELRAFGFSETGQTLTIAISCALTIFVR